MNVVQLPLEQQETASHCHSCGEVRSEEYLGTCLQCGYRLCFMDGCHGHCACTDDALGMAIAQIDSALAAIDARAKAGTGIPAATPSPEVLASLTRDIDASIASVNSYLA
jgi:hypothetical protein